MYGKYSDPFRNIQ